MINKVEDKENFQSTIKLFRTPNKNNLIRISHSTQNATLFKRFDL